MGRLAALVLPTLLCISCGQVYRPVVIPCTAGSGVPGCPVVTPPTPANFHAVFSISNNLAGSPGGALQIDVSGDSIIAETSSSDPKFGENPVHAAILPNNTRLFVASAGSVLGGVDEVTAFNPAFQSTTATGFGALNAIGLSSQSAKIASISEAGNTVTVNLATPFTGVPANATIVITDVDIPPCSPLPCTNTPPLEYDGAFPLTTIDPTGMILTFTNFPYSGLPAPSAGGIATFSPLPDFLNSAQTTAMYVANYNYNSISAINTTLNVVTNTVPVGLHPVAMAEIQNATKLYVANEGDNTVSSLNVATLSANTVINPATGTAFSGNTPVWVVARGDSQKVYVLTEGDGQLVTIDTATDTVSSSLPVGAGANFMLLDPHLNRLYVVNPATNQIFVFLDTGGVDTTGALNDTPTLLSATPLSIPGLTTCATCATPVPVSVAALADGTRFYVASYQIASTCPETIVSAGSCIIPLLTVFDAASLTPKYGSASTLTLLSAAFTVGQYSIVPAANCTSPVWPAVYAPTATTTRFRVFTTAATDSSHVYVSMCDAGGIADVITADDNINNAGGTSIAPDTLITDLPTAFSAGVTQSNGEPPYQNPVFMLSGQ